jgi:hypothetical protein
LLLAKNIPNKYDAIIGIPRSGLIPAAIIGFHFNIPVITVSEFSNNEHINGSRVKIKELKRVLLVDDSIGSGRTMKRSLETINIECDTAAIYTNSVKHDLTYILKRIDDPRIFQWNILNHGYLKYACIDFDGVLCKDPTIIEDDNKPEIIINHILNAEPLHIPKMKIFAIITNRIERYRSECETWLKEHNVSYDQLIMYPRTAEERRNYFTRLGGNGIWKGQQCNKIGGAWFIESNYVQAQQIRNIINSSVFCTDKMIML